MTSGRSSLAANAAPRRQPTAGSRQPAEETVSRSGAYGLAAIGRA